ncbi:hypothetical protein [Bacteriovorax sp. Seq25_V]|uniref:hypothetical protein n=1 Tax=Bacteriovorax sp. Seq25_V TaxID=1201288 RepID=UPI00038A3EF8|nr:hypothetical protein [Bacteriovorax sp. Seq25_V]EQC45306.1 hypothetical protein M900_2136 [Bacteriovorax sp. Seq25_V]
MSNFKRIIKDNHGFTLAQVMIAAALMGGLALGFMQIMKNINDGQSFANSMSDEMMMNNEINLILSEERYCRVSLAGDGEVGVPIAPVTFSKTDIDEDGEGLDIELFLSNQDGNARTIKKLSGTDPTRAKYGHLKIKSLKLLMNNSVGTTYSESASHLDMGVVRVAYEKKISSTKYREMTQDFPVKVRMKTNSMGESTILACSGTSLSSEGFKYPTSCKMTFSHRDNGGAFRNVELDMSSGGYVGLRLRGDVNGDDDFKITGNCSAGEEIDDYIKSCELGFGWRDSTDTGSSIVASPFKIRTSTFNGSVTINTDGDVNGDDSFYYRLRCPNGSNSDLNTYMKEKCMICMGHTDEWYASPQKQSCKKLQDLSDNSWGRIMTSGDVGADDAMFLGFFCEGEHYNVIKNWAY